MNDGIVFIIYIFIISIVILVFINTNSNNLYFKQKENTKSEMLSKLLANSNISISTNLPSFKQGTYFGQWLIDENGGQLQYAPNFGRSTVGVIIVYPQTGLVRLWKYGSDGFDYILGKYDVTKDVPPKQFIIDGISWDMFSDF
jgi:hypothetical protein